MKSAVTEAFIPWKLPDARHRGFPRTPIGCWKFTRMRPAGLCPDAV